jgi:hypothetical protein
LDQPSFGVASFYWHFRLAVPRSAGLVDPALRRERPTANITDFPGGLVHASPRSLLALTLIQIAYLSGALLTPWGKARRRVRPHSACINGRSFADYAAPALRIAMPALVNENISL